MPTLTTNKPRRDALRAALMSQVEPLLDAIADQANLEDPEGRLVFNLCLNDLMREMGIAAKCLRANNLELAARKQLKGKSN
jgi:hypothetical protein